MQLASVPCIVAAALALASIGQASPINQPKGGLEPARNSQLGEGWSFSYVTVPKTNQPRAERKGNEPEVYQPRAERKDNEPEFYQPRAERKNIEYETN